MIVINSVARSVGCPSGMCWGGGRLGLGLGAMHRFGRVVEGVFSVVKRLVNVLARFVNMVKEALAYLYNIFVALTS